MRQKTIDIYKFDELDDAAKDRARDWWRESERDDSFWSECVIEDAQRIGALMGIEAAKVYFSGFSCQGDGACFVGSWRAANVQSGAVKLEAPTDARLHYIAAKLERIAADYPDASAKVTHRGHYSHEHCTDIEDDAGDVDDETAERFAHDERENLADTLRDFMRWIYRQLEAEHTYRMSDESVDESIIANEYEFLKNGERA